MASPSSWQSQSLLTAAMSVGHGLVVLDPRGHVVWTNPAVEALLGWSRSELEGRHITELLGPLAQEGLTPSSARGDSGLPAGGARVKAVRKDGEERRIEFELFARPDCDGVLDGVAVVLRDVTEEELVGHELVRLRGHFQAGFVQGLVPQAVLDAEGRFVDVNDALCRLLRWSREELLGRLVLDFLDPRDPVSRTVLPAVPTGEPVVQRRHEVIAHDAAGRSLPLLVDVTPLPGEHGLPESYACMVTDLSEVHEAERRVTGQEAFYRALNRSATEVAIVSDAEGNLVYVSPSVTEFLGYNPSDVVASSGFDFVHPEDQTTAHELVESSLRFPSRTARALLRVQHASGQWRWVEETVTNLLADPDIGGLVANLRDVTVEIEGQIAVRRSEARYRAIVEAAHEGIIVLDNEANTMFANERLSEIVGYSLADIYEFGLWCAFDPDDAQVLHRRSMTRASTGPERYEIPFRSASGASRILSVSSSPLVLEEGRGVLAMVSDVTSERRVEEELRLRALHDSLTGLPNRALLADRLETAAARHHRSESRGVAMLFVDLDDMKRVNDRAGHACGDALLIQVAERMRGAVRDVDTLTRLGGDEFAILCEDVDPDTATMVAQRVERTFVEPFVIDGKSFDITASIGVALSPPHAVADLLLLADKAMYEAKERSPGTFLLFDSAMALGARRRTRLSEDIRAALTDQELVVHYQPIVDLSDGEIQGIEALVRWQHPTLGMLHPPEVLAAARESGVESQLDAAVLSIACRDMQRLMQGRVLPPKAYVAVNVSATTAVLAPLDETVPEALSRSGLPPHHLVLEITETAVMADVERSAIKLRSLAGLGVRIAVDDFGTGYSSLAYLHRLPVHILKIDRSFVEGLRVEGESTPIISHVLGLAEALAMRVVAEGVETAEQAAVLREMGCAGGQGYLWSPAVPAAALPAVIAAERFRAIDE